MASESVHSRSTVQGKPHSAFYNTARALLRNKFSSVRSDYFRHRHCALRAGTVDFAAKSV